MCHLLATHVITCVWPVAIHPQIGVLALRQALITPRTNRVDCIVPRGPVSHQRGPIRPRLALSVHLLRISPIRPALSCYLCRLVFLVLQTNQSSHLSSGEPLAAPRIFQVLHSVPALVSTMPSVDLHVHYIVHLVQDHFLHRSSGRLQLGKAAKGVAPVPGSKTKCCAPPRRTVWCRPVLWVERDAETRIPKEKIT